MTERAATDYQRKIRTREEILQLVGPRPRPRQVIMCHGTFDLVHPGHVRHLTYAKSKADILVVSLTSDAHIAKANFRPFVPQHLRAMNLAALEVVDYVLIDDNPTPLDNIRFLKPDIFAKGYEYFENGLHPRTQEELDEVQSYGGELIFTPGDIVFSSSAFIDTAPPRIAIDKLLTLMENEGVSFKKIREVLRSLRGVRVHVVGDTIVDTYTYCSLIGGTAKTPTFSVKYERQQDFTGGAAIVAKHLRKAGAEVSFSTVMGDDDLKHFVVDDLESLGVDCHVSIDRARPTTRKNTFVADGYRLLKVDTLDNRPISDRTLEEMKRSLAASTADVFVFSDFRHGIFSRRTIPELTEGVPTDALKVADSQVANRWGNILDFRGFDLITPNEREARFALGDQDSVIRPLAFQLYRRARCGVLILKLAERGILTYRHPSEDVRSFFTVDSFAGTVQDPVGAGDALLAYATLALASTRSAVLASILGSMSAAIACEHEGNIPVTPDDVLEKLDAVERAAG